MRYVTTLGIMSWLVIALSACNSSLDVSGTSRRAAPEKPGPGTTPAPDAVIDAEKSDEGRAALAVGDARDTVFGRGETEPVPEKTITITNGGRTAATQVTLTLAGPFRVKEGTCGASLAPSTDCQVTVAYAPDSGKRTANALSISYFDGISSQSLTLPLSVSPLTLASKTSLAGQTLAIALSGEVAYVGDGFDLDVFDMADRAAPSLARKIAIPYGGGSPWSVQGAKVVDQRLYLSGYYPLDLESFDLADPKSPVRLGGIANASLNATLAVIDKHVFASGYYGVFKAFDATDAANPTEVGGVTLPGDVGFLAAVASGHHVFTAGKTGNNLVAVDVGTPSAPSLTGSVAVGGGVSQSGLAVKGRHVYASAFDANVNQLVIVDVNDPANMAIASATTLSPTKDPTNAFINGAVTVLGSRLFIGTDKLYEVDVTDPGAPRISRSLALDEKIRGLAHDDHFLYALTAAKSLYVLDLGAP